MRSVGPSNAAVLVNDQCHGLKCPVRAGRPFAPHLLKLRSLSRSGFPLDKRSSLLVRQASPRRRPGCGFGSQRRPHCGAPAGPRRGVDADPGRRRRPRRRTAAGRRALRRQAGRLVLLQAARCREALNCSAPARVARAAPGVRRDAALCGREPQPARPPGRVEPQRSRRARPSPAARDSFVARPSSGALPAPGRRIRCSSGPAASRRPRSRPGGARGCRASPRRCASHARKALARRADNAPRREFKAPAPASSAQIGAISSSAVRAWAWRATAASAVCIGEGLSQRRRHPRARRGHGADRRCSGRRRPRACAT